MRLSNRDATRSYGDLRAAGNSNLFCIFQR
jgi:hypothetical protein